MAKLETLTLTDAQRIIASGIEEAEKLDVPYNIAVVDVGGNLIAHIRMDGAWIGSIDIAINKAWTSRAFDLPTEDIADKAEPGASLFGIHSTNHGRPVIFGGGLPVKKGDAVIGAVGASGGTVEQDKKVVRAALQGF